MSKLICVTSRTLCYSPFLPRLETIAHEQFEIDDSRSFDQMYQDMESEGLQPVLNDYLYV